MAAYHWIAGMVGLFAAWLAFTFIAQATGIIFGVINVIRNSSIPYDTSFDEIIDRIHQTFVGYWQWVPLIVFFAFVIYILVSSLRRRPEEAWI